MILDGGGYVFSMDGVYKLLVGEGRGWPRDQSTAVQTYTSKTPIEMWSTIYITPPVRSPSWYLHSIIWVAKVPFCEVMERNSHPLVGMGLFRGSGGGLSSTHDPR